MNHPVEQYAPAPAPSRLGQGTAVEQSRAVAEVQAAVLVARQFPRNVPSAIAQMKEACGQEALAERAFFRFPRGGSAVSGETIQLAKELARCWGNVQHGLVELRRDDEFRQSEMQAWAWDLESNNRVSTTFIVPHARWAKGKSETLSDYRDVYENNANNGARRLREMIFSVLPVWFREQAKTLCNATLQHGGGVPLPQRISDAIAGFGANGVTQDQLEQKLGRPSDKWLDHDVASLGVIFKSLQNGSVTVEDEFPKPRVTVDEITKKPEPTAGTSTAWPTTAEPGSGVPS